MIKFVDDKKQIINHLLKGAFCWRSKTWIQEKLFWIDQPESNDTQTYFDVT